jgi:hypothetical protein
MPVTKPVLIAGFYQCIFRDFIVCKCFALFIRHALPLTTNTTQIFIHKFIEKGNSQQFKYL